MKIVLVFSEIERVKCKQKREKEKKRKHPLSHKAPVIRSLDLTNILNTNEVPPVHGTYIRG